VYLCCCCCCCCCCLRQVDTKDILFVVGGAFIDLERQLMDSRHKSSIGFGNKVCWGRVCNGRAADRTYMAVQQTVCMANRAPGLGVAAR
jgi:hypothetical protein